jgi:nucleoside-diphosphate-sugar epimerase
MAAGETTLLTGATGFVGSMVLERLIADGAPVTVLIRAADDAAARRRLEEMALRTWGEEAVVGKVEVLAADLERDLLGLAPDVYDAIAERAGAVVHCAASVRFDLPLDEAQKVNVAGTERVVALCERARALGAPGRLVHLSTAYVHGRMTELGRETGPAAPPQFRNTYEMTKHSAEQVVARLGGSAIVRPSIIVGDSRSGWTSSFNVIYPGLRALLSGDLEVVPGAPDGILDVVAVDQVVDVVWGLLADPSSTGVVQTVGGEMAPTIEEFARTAYAHVGLPMTRCVPAAADQIGVYAPYVDVQARFEFNRAGKLGMEPVEIQELMPRLLDHAVDADWGRRPRIRPSPTKQSRDSRYAGIADGTVASQTRKPRACGAFNQ